jgi:N-methylhydantoinase B
VEALELGYPLRVLRYSLRRGSGGGGAHRGGDGIVREIRLLVPGQAAILAERHRIPPAGLGGGAPGKPGRAWRLGRRRERIPAKSSFDMEAGESLRVETPGGGGWGRRCRGRP